MRNDASVLAAIWTNGRSGWGPAQARMLGCGGVIAVKGDRHFPLRLLTLALAVWLVRRYQHPSLAGGRLVAELIGAADSRERYETLLTERRQRIGKVPDSILPMLAGKGYVEGMRRLHWRDRKNIMCYLVYDHNGESSHTYQPNTKLARGGVVFGYYRLSGDRRR
jgi:hypothetical protein